MKPRFLIIIILFFSLQSLRLFGQVDSIKKFPHYFWITGSAHQFISSPGNTLGNTLISTSVGLSYSFKHKHFIQLKWSNIPGGGDNIYTTTTSPQPNQLLYIKNFSFQYGIGHISKINTMVTFYCGISFGNGIFRGETTGTQQFGGGGGWLGGHGGTDYLYNISNFNYIGVPITFNIIQPIIPAFGIGGEEYVNLHKHADFGFGLTFHFGYIANRKLNS